MPQTYHQSDENIWNSDGWNRRRLENCPMRSFKNCTFFKYNCNDKVKEDEMKRACSTHEEAEECIQGLGGKDRRKETTRKI
jgi:hypothetical protein